MEAVWIAIATVVGGIVTLIVTSVITARASAVLAVERRNDRDAEWARQDIVADRLAAAQAAAARRVEEVAVAQAATATAQGTQLATIHTLVNSGYTTSLENELASHKALLVLLRKQKPQDAETKQAIALTLARINRLEPELSERMRATEEAAAAAAAATTAAAATPAPAPAPPGGMPQSATLTATITTSGAAPEATPDPAPPPIEVIRP